VSPEEILEDEEIARREAAGRYALTRTTNPSTIVAPGRSSEVDFMSEPGVCPGGRTLEQRKAGEKFAPEDKFVCPGGRPFAQRATAAGLAAAQERNARLLSRNQEALDRLGG
jgi:hypothetical protein